MYHSLFLFYNCLLQIISRTCKFLVVACTKIQCIRLTSRLGKRLGRNDYYVADAGVVAAESS